MRWRGAFLIGGVVLLVVAGIGVTLLKKHRATQATVYGVNNLRELTQFVQLHTGGPSTEPLPAGMQTKIMPDPRFKPTPLDKLRELGLAPQIPAGTIPSMLPPEERLSWVVTLMPSFNQNRQDTGTLYRQLDQTLTWNGGPNQAVSEVPLKLLLSYSNPALPVPGEPAKTQFVGLAGIGADGATLPPTDPRAGCFRYQSPTDFAGITDGLSQTILFGEVSTNLGPWLRGGPSTLRSLDLAAPPYLGTGGQFGGNQPAGTIFGMADSGVRIFTDRTHRDILHNLITLSGGHPIPGE
ncbi:MAG: DUF1559 domain-containing protein [Fimbriiglobus sp.]